MVLLEPHPQWSWTQCTHDAQVGPSNITQCDCGALVQSCLHIVNDFPLRRFPGGLERLAQCAETAKIEG